MTKDELPASARIEELEAALAAMTAERDAWRNALTQLTADLAADVRTAQGIRDRPDTALDLDCWLNDVPGPRPHARAGTHEMDARELGY